MANNKKKTNIEETEQLSLGIGDAEIVEPKTEKKPKEKKATTKKPAEKKPAEKKTVEKKPAEKKTTTKKPAEKKAKDNVEKDFEAALAEVERKLNDDPLKKKETKKKTSTTKKSSSKKTTNKSKAPKKQMEVFLEDEPLLEKEPEDLTIKLKLDGDSSKEETKEVVKEKDVKIETSVKETKEESKEEPKEESKEEAPKKKKAELTPTANSNIFLIDIEVPADTIKKDKPAPTNMVKPKAEKVPTTQAEKKEKPAPKKPAPKKPEPEKKPVEKKPAPKKPAPKKPAPKKKAPPVESKTSKYVDIEEKKNESLEKKKKVSKTLALVVPTRSDTKNELIRKILVIVALVLIIVSFIIMGQASKLKKATDASNNGTNFVTNYINSYEIYKS